MVKRRIPNPKELAPLMRFRAPEFKASARSSIHDSRSALYCAAEDPKGPL